MSWKTEGRSLHSRRGAMRDTHHFHVQHKTEVLFITPFVDFSNSTYLLKMRLSSPPASRIPFNETFRSTNPCTCRALLYFFMSASPMTRNDGKLFQHVFMAHEPLTPWHLQSVRNRLFTNCVWSSVSWRSMWWVESYMFRIFQRRRAEKSEKKYGYVVNFL